MYTAKLRSRELELFTSDVIAKYPGAGHSPISLELCMHDICDIRGGRTCSRASVEEFNLMSEFCYFSLFWLDYGQLKKLHTANGNSSTHADWAHAF